MASKKVGRIAGKMMSGRGMSGGKMMHGMLAELYNKLSGSMPRKKGGKK